MKYQSNILALKYRPSNFQDLIGQEYLVETIQKSIEQNKIPNAYILLVSEVWAKPQLQE